MEFKTGIKVGDNFVSNEELEELQREKYALLYFLRREEYHLFHDFPCMGSMGRLLFRSLVEGPFDLKPDVKEGTEYDNHLEKVVERVIPVDGVPDKFERVELVRYGININPEFVEFINANLNLNWDKIKEIGHAAFKTLEEISGGLERIDDFSKRRSVYKTFLDGIKVDFVYDCDNFESRMCYPSVVLICFGKDYDHYRLIERLGLDRLYSLGEDGVFRPYNDKKIGFEHSVRSGLSYGLEIGKDLDLSNLNEMENIIL